MVSAISIPTAFDAPPACRGGCKRCCGRCPSSSSWSAPMRPQWPPWWRVGPVASAPAYLAGSSAARCASFLTTGQDRVHRCPADL